MGYAGAFPDADGVERLAAESLLERQKWVNRIMSVLFYFIAML
jgi:hypothetical protein